MSVFLIHETSQRTNYFENLYHPHLSFLGGAKSHLYEAVVADPSQQQSLPQAAYSCAPSISFLIYLKLYTVRLTSPKITDNKVSYFAHTSMHLPPQPGFNNMHHTSVLSPSMHLSLNPGHSIVGPLGNLERPSWVYGRQWLHARTVSTG